MALAGGGAGGIECTFLLAEVSRLPGSPPPPPPSSPPTRRSHTKRRRLCPARRHCARVRDVGSPARTCDGRAPPLVPSSPLRRSSCERASKQASILYLLARSLLGVAEAAGGNGRGRSSDSHSNSRLSSNLGRVTLAEAALLTSTAAATATTAKAVSVSAASVRRSVGRGAGGEKRNLPPSASRPPARPSPGNLRQLGPKVGGAVTILRRRCDCEGKER